MPGRIKGAQWAWRGIHTCSERAQLLKAAPSVLLCLLILQDKPADTFLKKCPKNNALNIQVEM